MPSTILLKDIPADVYQAVLNEQHRLTTQRRSKVSLNVTIIRMLRELTKIKNNDKPSSNEL